MTNSKTNLFAIIGNPVEQSLSPTMHNAAFQKLNINAIYLAFNVTNLKNAIKGVKALGIKGISITIPHKTETIKYLDEIDPYAEKMYAVNTIVNSNNKLKGYNTDGLGALNSIKNTNININKQNITIIGNGGTAKAITFALLNYDKPKLITIIGRNKKNINKLISNIKTHFHNANINYHTTIQNAQNNIKNSSLIINTTPLGMHGYEQISPIPKEYINQKHTIFDVVYKPLKTKLLQYAEEKNARTINGLDMLLNQGIIQFELWTGKKAPKDTMIKALSQQTLK